MGRSATMTTDSPPGVDRLVRSRGVLLGAAVGDALGWPQEQRSGIVGGARSRNVKPQAAFREWRRNSGTQFGRYVETVGAGEYSDDTQLLLAVARACGQGDAWFDHLTRVELPAWLSYQRGGGRAVLMAARAWLNGHAPWVQGSKQADPERYFAAGANGVAMRIAPHAMACCDSPPENLVERVLRDGITTHGHPRALAGGVLHSLTLWSLLRTSGTLGYGELVDQLRGERSWRRVELGDVLPSEWIDAYEERTKSRVQHDWSATVKEVDSMLDLVEKALKRGALADDEATLGELGCFDPKVNGSGTVTAVAALYMTARSAARPMSGLLGTAFLKRADTDTLASMAASTLGALHGPDWLGTLAAEVQDAPYIENVSTGSVSATTPQQVELFSATHVASDGPSAQSVSSRDHKRVVSLLEDEGAREGAFVDGRPFTLIERKELETKAKASVTRYSLKLADGQTVVMDRLHRTPNRSDVRAPAEQNGPSSPPTKPEPGAVRRVTVLVRDLSAMANFYRNVLGLPVRGHGDGIVEIGPALRLRVAPAKAPVGGGVLIEVTASDLARVRAALGVPADAGNTPIECDDPEGNQVIVHPLH